MSDGLSPKGKRVMPPKGKRASAHSVYEYVLANAKIVEMPVPELQKLARKQSHRPLSVAEIKKMASKSERYKWARHPETSPDGDGRGNYYYYAQPPARSRGQVMHEGFPTLDSDPNVQRQVANTLKIAWDPTEHRFGPRELRDRAEHELDYLLREFAEVARKQVWIRVSARYGDHPSNYYIAEVLVPKQYAYIAFNSSRIHFDLTKEEKKRPAQQRVLLMPEFKTRFVLHGSNVEKGLPTTSIASDVIYFGEKKKADKTQLGERFTQETGYPSMHVGTRLTYLKEGGKFRKSLDIFNAVSLGGKTAHSTDDLDDLLVEGEWAGLFGDDILLAHAKYFIQPERGMYYSLIGLTSKEDAELFDGRGRFFENVPTRRGRPTRAAEDAVWHKNMRCLVDRVDIPGTVDEAHIKAEGLDEANFFVMTRNSHLPPLMRTGDVDQWLTHFVLGETKTTAAEVGGAPGRDTNEPLNDPFIPAGRIGDRINATRRLINDLKKKGIKVNLYVTNNSSVYGEDHDVTLDMSRKLFLEAKRGGGEWKHNKDLHMEVMVGSEYIKGLYDYMPWKIVGKQEFQSDLQSLDRHRLGVLARLMIRNGFLDKKLALDGKTPVAKNFKRRVLNAVKKSTHETRERLHRHKTRKGKWNEFSDAMVVDVVETGPMEK
ncbi:MAG: phosphoenolpyruvate carboxykinase (ATP) [Candidatus Diapherotrites archaeon]|nr:phosphoenolpyruvate carboxykinase (ATP) [Candidatus Diapherotrites archaeon]